jgi:hypothetical protein
LTNSAFSWKLAWPRSCEETFLRRAAQLLEA